MKNYTVSFYLYDPLGNNPKPSLQALRAMNCVKDSFSVKNVVTTSPEIAIQAAYNSKLSDLQRYPNCHVLCCAFIEGRVTPDLEINMTTFGLQL